HCTKKQIDQLETELIRAAVLRGEELLNKRKVAVAKKTESTVIKHEVIVTRYDIHDDEKTKRLRIRWNKNVKEFGYARCGREAAMKKAEEFREELRKQMVL